MHPTKPLVALALTLGAVLPSAWAVDYGAPAAPSATVAADPLDRARALIGEQRWQAAIDELRRVDRADNADWNNLMGYALRKRASPDLDAALRHYDAALRIDPRHRGALEYSGELFLMRRDVAAARQRLATLEAVCGRGCAEHAQLQAAIARFEQAR